MFPSMISSLPPSITSLIVVFLLATPLFSLASPFPEANTNLATPAKLQPRQPQPTRRMGARRVKKPEPLKKKDYSSFLCPGGSVACPIPGSDITPASAAALEGSLNSLADWFTAGFECIELNTELDSCGGCLALGMGQDCTAIPNTRTTGCETGSCAVYSCFDGFVVSPDRKTCVKKGTATPATPVTAIHTNDQAVLDDGGFTSP